VPVGVTAFGAASVPRAPRARADARSDRTLATRAAPRFPPPGRLQTATGAPCGARRHPSSSPLCRRVRSWRLTALTTRANRRPQTRASPNQWRYVDRRPGSVLPRPSALRNGHRLAVECSRIRFGRACQSRGQHSRPPRRARTPARTRRLITTEVTAGRPRVVDDVGDGLGTEAHRRAADAIADHEVPDAHMPVAADEAKTQRQPVRAATLPIANRRRPNPPGHGRRHEQRHDRDERDDGPARARPARARLPRARPHRAAPRRPRALLPRDGVPVARRGAVCPAAGSHPAQDRRRHPSRRSPKRRPRPASGAALTGPKPT
jgi:hypothetical protein